MADLSSDAQLTPDDAVLAATSKLFFYLWETVWRHAPATGAGDAEGLHDMRVAIRRLRSALENFEGSASEPLLSRRLSGEFRSQRRRLGRMGDLLGAVRDYDVLDDYLREYAKDRLKRDIADCEGLARFERYLQTGRAAAFAPMVKRINRAQEAGKLREEFGRWALGLPAAIAPPLSLRDAAAAIIPQRIADVYAHAAALSDGSNADGHHEFRKTLRRLRYALETLGVCFVEPVKPCIKTLVQAQDILGEMQDRDVLRAAAHRAFEVKPDESLGEDGSTPSLPPDVAEFLRWGEVRRRSLLGQARKWWAAHENGGVLHEIQSLLERS